MRRDFIPDVAERADRRHEKKQKQQIHVERERAAMATRAQERVSFGTLTIFPPKPESHVGTFTVAFSKPLKCCKLYPLLAEVLGDYWGTTRSVYIQLENPPEWQETRERILQVLEPLLISEEVTT